MTDTLNIETSGKFIHDKVVLLDPNLRKENVDEVVRWGNQKFEEIKNKDTDAILSVSLAQFDQTVGIFKKGEIDIGLMGTVDSPHTSVNGLFELSKPGYISTEVQENILTYFKDNGYSEAVLFNEEGKNKMSLTLGGFGVRIDFGYNNQEDSMRAYGHAEPKKGFRYDTIFVGAQVYDGEKPFVAGTQVSEIVPQLIDVGNALALASQLHEKPLGRLINWNGMDLDSKVYTSEDGRMVDGKGRIVGLIISPTNYTVAKTVAEANTSKL